MIFEFWLSESDADGYRRMSSELRSLLEDIDGFAGIERYDHPRESGRHVAIGFFESEEAVTAWRNDPTHRTAQELGRRQWFSRYRLRMAEVTRDYDADRRATAPTDSNQHHPSGDRPCTTSKST